MSFSIKCMDCGAGAPFDPSLPACPTCGSQWRQAEYDYETIGRTLRQLLPQRPFDLWRYRELLPIHAPNAHLSLGEGFTPLIKAVNLGMMLGCENLYIKDERQGPTSSFKDRQAVVTIAALKEAGITELVAASTGNVAISYSAYASRAGIKLWAFVTSLVPSVKMREIALYGSQVIKITGSYDQCKQMAAEFASQRGLYLDMGARTISSIEGMKTIAFEVSEQLTLARNGNLQSEKWATPDWYIQAVSGGMGPVGVHKGFREMQKMGWVDKIPSIAPIQAEGCAPMASSWKKGLKQAEPVLSPNTRIETLATGDPGRTYEVLRECVEQTGGVFESVSDEEAFRAMHVLAKMEGISVEPAAGVAIAGLFKLVRAGVIKPTDTVVINCTGHTVPADTFLLGENWSRDVNFPSEESPREGLLSALTQVAPEKFPKIAVVEDTSDARRLIRRILQSQGNFEILEADNGLDGLALIHQELPNLAIIDLMMPGMDGFSVVEAMRARPETAAIPVIVATAKDLSREEKSRLQGQIQALMQKGDFLSDEFLSEVKQLIG